MPMNLMNYKFQAQIWLMIYLSIKEKIEMNNDQTGLILSEMSILAGTYENITKYSNQMCRYRVHFSTNYAKTFLKSSLCIMLII